MISHAHRTMQAVIPLLAPASCGAHEKSIITTSYVFTAGSERSSLRPVIVRLQRVVKPLEAKKKPTVESSRPRDSGTASGKILVGGLIKSSRPRQRHRTGSDDGT